MRSSRTGLMLVITAFLAVTAYGQERTRWRTTADIQDGVRGTLIGTVADVDETNNQLQVEADDDSGPRATVLSDSVSTQFNGFGGLINGQPEIFTGSQGIANVRVGDRVNVMGIGQGNNSIRAIVITLLGRQVAVPQTGIGTSRPPMSVSTPITTSTADRVGPMDGVVQEVSASDGRVVIITDQREMLTVRTSSATPVYYNNEKYRVANLEVGDRIRVEPEGSGDVKGELRARSIQVTHSVSGGANIPKATRVIGRVSRVERGIDMVTVDTGTTSVRVDVASAMDLTEHRVRANDFQAGDHVEITGRYSPTAIDLFIATTVKFVDEVKRPAPAASGPGGMVAGGSADSHELDVLTIYGVVRGTLAESPQIVVRDSAGRTFRIDVVDDFAVRARNGRYTTADKLRVGESVIVKALRDSAGSYIAQTIRVR